jgi:hypothetical protein
MKSALMLAGALAVFAGSACAGGTYESYDAFYAAQPGTVFGDPVKFDAGVVYSGADGQGVQTELRTTLGAKAVRVALADDRITVNGKTYRYASAATLPGEHPADFPPQSADVFLAARTNAHRAVLCVQGDSNGSGEADRHKQIYLLINPLAPTDHATFLHLPSLFSSCRAVLATKDGEFILPMNSYMFDDAQESRVGLLVSYYTFEDRRFAPTLDEIRLRFTRPESPFEFSIEGKK